MSLPNWDKKSTRIENRRIDIDINLFFLSLDGRGLGRRRAIAALATAR
jgi:hypothetical protein